MKTNRVILIHLISMITMIGCEDEDQRVAAVATAAAERQAQQSAEMAKAHAQLTHGARELVESAGRSQESLVTIQRELETQQSEIGRQRDLLEKERQTIATQRRTDPIIANAVLQIGLLIVCALPLIVCWYVLRDLGQNNAEEPIGEILIEDLTSERPLLLPEPKAPIPAAGHLPSRE